MEMSLRLQLPPSDTTTIHTPSSTAQQYCWPQMGSPDGGCSGFLVLTASCGTLTRHHLAQLVASTPSPSRTSPHLTLIRVTSSHKHARNFLSSHRDIFFFFNPCLLVSLRVQWHFFRFFFLFPFSFTSRKRLQVKLSFGLSIIRVGKD